MSQKYIRILLHFIGSATVRAISRLNLEGYINRVIFGFHFKSLLWTLPAEKLNLIFKISVNFREGYHKLLTSIEASFLYNGQ